MDMRNMQKIMQQMKTEELKVTEVVFNFPDGRQWTMAKPQVIQMNVMGQTTFQVIGKPVESSGISEEDVKFVMEQVGVGKAEAEKTLKETGDVAATILKLKKSP